MNIKFIYYYKIVLFFLSVFVLGCQKTKQIIIETKNRNLQNIVIPKPIIDANIIDKLEYIILESNDNSLLGNVIKMRVYEDRIYVLDRIYAGEVFIYSIDGKHIATIGKNKGQGPLDFVNVHNFEIDYANNLLIIMDNYGQKFMIYNTDGEFIKKINSKLRVTDAVLLQNGNIVHAKSSSEHKLSGQSNSKIFITDDNQNIIKEGFEYDDNSNINLLNYNIIRSEFNGDVVYAPRFKDTIYTVTLDSITPRFTLDYGNNKKISNREIENIKTNQELFSLLEQGNLCFLGINVESKDYLYLSLGFGLNATVVFYNKNTTKTLSISRDTKNYDLFKILCADIDGYFYGAFNNTPLDELIELFPELQHLVDPDDMNPILFRYKIKNE